MENDGILAVWEEGCCVNPEYLCAQALSGNVRPQLTKQQSMESCNKRLKRAAKRSGTNISCGRSLGKIGQAS